MRKFYMLFGLWAAFLSVNAREMATFEEITLQPGSWWNGSDGSGGVYSGDFWFPNSYNADYQSWSGFAVSNMTDTLTAGYENQYSAITGAGVNGSDNYAVVYTAGEALEMELEDPVALSGFFITNSTYACLSMKNGDAYSKKFGGADGSDPDYFKLIISGTGLDGTSTEDLEVYLADYRDEDSQNDRILEDWQWVDLSSLGVVKGIKFRLESSDNGAYGMNTPAYFCLDDFNGGAAGARVTRSVANIEDLDLPEDSYYNGSDGEGQFISGGITFKNNYNSDYGSWSGFAASTVTDTVTAGYSNQYSAIAGEGAINTKSYAVGCPFETAEMEFEETLVHGFFVTNATYAYRSMLEGDSFAKKFGGPEGNDPDWFKLTVAGISSDGDTTGLVEYMLADYTFEDNDEDYLVNDWEWVELSSLDTISKLRFSLSSSDNGTYGMNTPGYFCLDEFIFQELPPEVRNPVGVIGEEDNPPEVFYVELDSVFTDPDDPDDEIELKLEAIDNADLLTGMIVMEEDSGTGGNKIKLALHVTPEMTGEAEVVISGTSKGKTAYHSFFVVVNNPVASPLLEKPEVKVYPNPVVSYFYVELPDVAEEMRLTGASGQILFQQMIHSERSIYVDALQGQSPGIYFLKVKTAGGWISRKILKY